jgi:hypothetical protein
MKNLFDLFKGYNAKNVTIPKSVNRLPWNLGSLLYMLTLISTFLFTGCKQQEIVPENETEFISDKETSADKEFRTYYDGLDKQTVQELQQARAATARYRNLKNAIADGYKNINVVSPNMGHHYMKSQWVDATFDIQKPEILVYSKDEDGSFELVAVEYAIPIELTPDVSPEGFTGTGDVWDHNLGFKLWLLHAWVWKNNPAGVFNPTNPLVEHQH